jgi:hypothetical protein
MGRSRKPLGALRPLGSNPSLSATHVIHCLFPTTASRVWADEVTAFGRFLSSLRKGFGKQGLIIGCFLTLLAYSRRHNSKERRPMFYRRTVGFSPTPRTAVGREGGAAASRPTSQSPLVSPPFRQFCRNAAALPQVAGIRVARRVPVWRIV